jgi:4-hydroxy-4-methyl-2-oxoglutarate aldolase
MLLTPHIPSSSKTLVLANTPSNQIQTMDLSTADLETLRSLSTPTVSNAVELFNVRSRSHGFMSPEVRCLFPDLGVMVGYAVTARFAAEQQPARPGSRYELWKYVLSIPEPRVLVFQDLDQPAGVGAYFGEVQTSIHKKLGCIGVVTNGHVRDLDEVRALGFHYFAGGVCVSHAYVHLIDFGSPVKVGGMVVNPGELIHADKHGVMTLPKEFASQVPKAAAQVAEREQRIIGYCKSPDFTVEGLKKVYES